MTDKQKYVENTLTKELTQQQLEWVKNQYLPFLDRQGLSENTKTNYLQMLRKLLSPPQSLKPWNLNNDNLDTEAKKIAGKIQSSEYQTTDTDMGRRRKSMMWKTLNHIVEIQGLDTNRLPSFKPKDTGDVNRQASNTRPEDLPNPNQVQSFVEAIGKHSGETHSLRNQALILLMWDKGPRIGEALNIQLKDCEIQNDKLEIFIHGNKGSSDRKVQIYQGRETLKEFIQTHPGGPEDYLFSDLRHNNLDRPVSRSKIASKIKAVASREKIGFKVKGEPNHIFRKAMTTAHVVNGWATWEEITQLQGKSVSGTKPTYLRMALSDVNQSIGEKIGASNGTSMDQDFHMKGEPLLPQKCKACGKVNKCFVESCAYCSGQLETPDRSSFQKDAQEEIEWRDRLLKAMQKNPELVRDTLEDALK